MINELSLNPDDIDQSLKNSMYNNIMATYLLLSRTGGVYNNQALTAKVLYQIHYATIL